MAGHARHRLPVAAGLLDEAHAALQRGVPRDAAQLAEQALHQPLPMPLRADVLHVLGMARFLDGDHEGITHLEEALRLSRDPRERATIGAELVSVLSLYDRVPAAIRLADELIAGLDAGDTLRRYLSAVRMQAAAFDCSTTALVAEGMSIEEELLAGTDREERLFVAVAAYLQARRGSSADATAALARTAAQDGRLLTDASLGILGVMYAGVALLVSDHFAEAETLIDEFLVAADERGSVMMFNGASWLHGCLRWRRGELLGAITDLRTAVDVSRSLRTTTSINAAMLARALIDAGDVAGARQELDAALRTAQVDADRSTGVFGMYVLDARAHLALAEGELSAGIADLTELGRRCALAGDHNPAQHAWRSSLALALWQRGDADEASSLAREELRLARRFGAPRAISIAARVSGVVEGDLELLRTAVDVTAGQPVALVRAEALLAYGAALRRANHRAAAKDALREAHALAESCAAAPLVARATEELAAAGVRRPAASQDELTVSERRVCELAAGGMSNPEIARTLFISRATVESHLHASYRKLAISSRGELARAL